MIQFYNTLGKKKEDFEPMEDKKVKLYTCGPTVYDFAHIGNFRAYVFGDLLKRYLKFRGYDVLHVMNLTDVDDKTIKRSQEEGVSLQQYTEEYTKAFFEDLKTLKIEKADIFPKATEHIKEMVELVKKLMQKGHAYKGEDGSIYYKISSFKEYGKLSGTKIKGLKAGARVKQDEYTKERANDFALWKAWDESDGDVFWETELGKGRPGWHIECSAMSMKYLGESFDIHTGGVDLIFPHHENEIAQSEGATGKQFVKYWLHNEHLLVEGKKMSKSLGNFYTLRDLLKKGCKPRAIRLVLLSTHYRQKLNFSFDDVKAAEKTLERIDELVRKLENRKKIKTATGAGIKKNLDEFEKKFEKAMDNDLDISNGLAAFFELMKELNKHLEQMSDEETERTFEMMKKIDSVLDIFRFEVAKEIPEEIKALVEMREEVRRNKNWKKSDELREKIKERGWRVDDTAKEPVVKKL